MGIGTFVAVYAVVIVMLFVAFVLRFAWSEIKFKAGALRGFKGGRGVVELIQNNNVPIRKIVNFSDNKVEIKGKTYELEEAKNNPTLYYTLLWDKVPSVRFREGHPSPMKVIPGKESPIDLDYFNKLLEIAYLAGATEQVAQDLKLVKMFVLGCLVISGLSLLATVGILVKLQPVFTLIAQAGGPAVIVPKLLALIG